MAGTIRVWLASTAQAHALARHAARQSHGIDLEIGREAAGRPFIIGAPHLHLAMSHSRAFAAVVITDLGPVGVDIEPIRPLPAKALARHWFSEPEAAWVEQRPDDFLLLWTQKEAVGKALGIGLRQGGLRRPMPLPPTAALTSVVPGLPEMAVAAWAHEALVIGLACDSGAALGAQAEVAVVSDPI